VKKEKEDKNQNEFVSREEDRIQEPEVRSKDSI